jgi:hypothetical protein
MSSTRVIGFDRELQLDWLDAVAARVASGAQPGEVREWLDVYLGDQLGGEGPGGHRGKTVTVLGRIWSNVPSHCRTIRDDALQVITNVPQHERLAVHWAMATAIYPFFGEVTATVGRLLSLQGDVVRAAVIKRLAESWGDRPAVRRATRAVWTSLAAWQTMTPTAARGHYQMRASRHPTSAATTRLLVEATMYATHRDAISMQELQSWPGFYPFAMTDLRSSVVASSQLMITREGIDLEMLRRCR